MAKAKLYQRIRMKSFPWVVCEMAKNGTPKPHPEAFQFGVRYSFNGQRKLDTAKSLDEALAMLRDRDIRLYAAKKQTNLPPAVPEASALRVTITQAVQQYLADKLAEGKDPKTIGTYRRSIEQFVASCSKKYIDETGKQDLKNFMGWLRLHPVAERRNSNPGQTYRNKILNVVIFLKAFGKEKLLKKSEYPACTPKIVSAHPDEELDLLYGHANDEERFLLDFFLGSALRKGEASHAEYSDLVGCVLEIKHKPHLKWHPKKHHCRSIRIPQALADAIRERQKKSDSTLIFPNRDGTPNQHLLRTLQNLAKRAGAKFHTELHKLRKTTATRWAKHMPLHIISRALGHKNLLTTTCPSPELKTAQIPRFGLPLFDAQRLGMQDLRS